LSKKLEPIFVKEVLWEPPFDKEVFGEIRPPFGQRRPEKTRKKLVFEPQAEGAPFVSNPTFTLDSWTPKTFFGV